MVIIKKSLLNKKYNSSCNCINKRQTYQKIKIYEYLKSVKTHPKAEEIYNHLIKEIPTITLATVYRNLHSLTDEGKIIKLEINKEYRFDADLENHIHFICNNCDCIIDLHIDKINDYIKKQILNYNFDINNINVILRGTCNKCKK
jgi:Fe2+ or Zn2+ uptake regulation protein